MANGVLRLIETRLRAFFATVHVTVFAGAALIILAFVLFGVLFPRRAEATFDFLHATITEYFGWYYLLVVTLFLLFALWLFFSRYGSIRLGDVDERPEFGFVAWFAMLFSCGMGIGIVFWGIAEPVLHFQEPPRGEPRTAEALNQAMVLTFFHWGLHSWAIYVVMGLSLAYFSFRYRLPMTIRSIFYPLLGNRIYGPIGHAIDILAVFGTVFGLATSLGLGAIQLNTGLNTLLGVPVSTGYQVLIIATITTIAVGSVVSGLHKGLKWLSVLNLVLALGVMLFFLVAGPTLFNIRLLMDSTGTYFQELIQLSFWADAVGGSEWHREWTIFYWGWWIAWSPFVGIFIARVSRGRTIREFVGGVLGMPVLFIFVWMSMLGGTALHLEFFAEGASPGISEAVLRDTTLALYVTLQQLPLDLVVSTIATMLIATYFITSSDSGTHVVDALISRGSKRSPTRQRVIWGIAEGAVAATLLIVGGQAALRSLQTGSIVAGLPFSVILLLICYSLWRALTREYRVEGVKPPWP